MSRSDNTTAVIDSNSDTDAIAIEEISSTPTDSSKFQSFWMGGFECSTHRLSRRKALGRFAGVRLDLVAATQHDEFAFEDYERLQRVAIRTARDGVRWHLIDKSSSHYDFSSLLPMLRAARQTETQVIWDLLHYGDHHCHSGLWGYADDEGHREVYEPLALELAHQQHLWTVQRREHVAFEEAVSMDELDDAARQVDVAATRSRTTRRE